MEIEKFSIDNVLRISSINYEFELEQANSLFNKLKLMVKDDPSLKPLRIHLADLIEKYENEHWTDENDITDIQIQESDLAERLTNYRNTLIDQRKGRIKRKLKKLDLNQNDLAKILGHRKNYMSELINGVRPFSQEDIIIIHRVLGIKLDHLIIPVIKEKVATRLRSVIKALDKPELNLNGEDLSLEYA